MHKIVNALDESISAVMKNDLLCEYHEEFSEAKVVLEQLFLGSNCNNVVSMRVFGIMDAYKKFVGSIKKKCEISLVGDKRYQIRYRFSTEQYYRGATLLSGPLSRKEKAYTSVAIVLVANKKFDRFIRSNKIVILGTVRDSGVDYAVYTSRNSPKCLRVVIDMASCEEIMGHDIDTSMFVDDGIESETNLFEVS